jgi:hypothetical protein
MRFKTFKLSLLCSSAQTQKPKSNQRSNSASAHSGLGTLCFTVGISTLPNPQADVATTRLCSDRLRFAHLIYATRRSQRHILPKIVNFPRGARKGLSLSQGPKSVTTAHSQPLPARTYPQKVVPVYLSACKMPILKPWRSLCSQLGVYTSESTTREAESRIMASIFRTPVDQQQEV